MYDTNSVYDANRMDTRAGVDRDARVDTTGPAGLARLDDLDDFEVAGGFPDPRGWDVKAANGKALGKVESLIVSPREMRVRYLEVRLDKDALDLPDDRRVLIPVGAVRLDDDRDDVLVDGLALSAVAGLPAFAGGPIGRDYETDLRRRFDPRFTGAADGQDYYAHPLYDQDRLAQGRRRTADDGVRYITTLTPRDAGARRR